MIPPTLEAAPVATDLEHLNAAQAALNVLLLGKTGPIRLALACVLARGHLLIEDVPGLGKTILAQGLARVLGLDFKRVQFTSDLLPADITGGAVWDRGSSSFRFTPGPVFTEVLLADEINRSSPKTQSALLEAMEERQVSVDGQSHALPDIFFVVATQNPLDSEGTHALPDAQLDRFLMRIALGYPDRTAELELLSGEDRRTLLPRQTALLGPRELAALQLRCNSVTTTPVVLDYLWRLLNHTRQGGTFRQGLSPRAGLSLLAAARAWALIGGRCHVVPADVQAVWSAVVSHRLSMVGQGDSGMAAEAVLQAVPVVP